MLKQKIENIIYNEDLTDVEREDWYVGGDDGYNWKEIYESRIISLAKDIAENGASYTLDLAISEKTERLQKATINFLKTLTKDYYTEQELNKITIK